MVEYWLWSAMQKSTGSEDLTNGCQNCLRMLVRLAYQATAEAAKTASKATATARRLPAMERCFVGGDTETVDEGVSSGATFAGMGNSFVPADKPAGRPGHANCGA